MGWIFGLSVLLFLGSLIVIPLLIARMRPDYFVSRTPPADSWTAQHRAIRYGALLLKNGTGLVLLAAGIAMLVLPGQGIITILVSMTLLDFPGKRRLELRIARQRRVRKAIEWIRRRARRQPLIIPDPSEDA
ncbi:MAG: hypothetical protein GY716_19890 [bacterium]|nr:hypothetical protein [bacterium]